MPKNIYWKKYWFKKSRKSWFLTDLFKLINNSVFQKAMENFGKHKDIKLVTAKKEKSIWCQKQIMILQSFSQKIYWL